MSQRYNGAPKVIIPIKGAPKYHLITNVDEQLVVAIEHGEPSKPMRGSGIQDT